MESLLTIKNLHVSLQAQGKTIQAVRGINFEIHRGETLGIVGESGCGKSMTAKAILRLLPDSAGIDPSSSILFNNEELLQKNDRQMEEIRGRHVGMIFQDPMTSLDPTMKIGKQIMEGLIKHKKCSSHEAKKHALHLLSLVGISHPEQRINQYPFEFSGGMRQRVMIAIALACGPELLIADEPTTALDVTIQAQILALLKELKETQQASLLLITHDLGVVASMCDRVIVMYAGQIMESGPVKQILYHPQHPYTKALLQAMPKLGSGKIQALSPIVGAPPDLAAPPSGCPFYPRCPYAMNICQKKQPPLFPVGTHHESACWLHHKLAKGHPHPFRRSE